LSTNAQAVNARMLAQQIAGLQRQINGLQQLVEEFSGRLAIVRAAREAVSKLKEKGEAEVLVTADMEGNALFKAKVSGKPIIHLGLNVYAEVPFEKAEEILSEKERTIVTYIGRLQEELREKLKEHRKLQELLYMLAQQQGTTGETRAG